MNHTVPLSPEECVRHCYRRIADYTDLGVTPEKAVILVAHETGANAITLGELLTDDVERAGSFSAWREQLTEAIA